MPYMKLQFRPGIVRDTTSYGNEGGWYDCDKVRFRMGFPEKIGGWEPKTHKTFLGSCRALHPWTALDGSQYLGVGTNLKYYVDEGGGFNDITPIRATTAAGDVTFSASANTLAADVAIGDTTVSLTSSTGFPTSGRVQIDSEIITYASVSGNDLIGCARGQDGTTEAAHTSTTAVNCATLLVSNTNHGALENDFVTFSGATTLGDQVTADVLNQEYQITVVVNTDTYQVEARTVSTISSITITSGLDATYVFATASDSGSGGASVVGAYQLNTGLDTAIVGTGWGAGAWGRDTWGSSASVTTVGTQLGLWTHDHFEEDLLINQRDGGIYYFDTSGGLASRAVSLGSLSGASGTPTVARQILVSNNARHIVVFGCDSEVNPGVQDPMLIRFSSQASLTDWTTQITNTAGELRLGSGSEIIAAIETRREILVFTDTTLNSMQFLGPPFTFGVNAIADNVSIVGPKAVAGAQDTVYWMGKREFYSYSGRVDRIQCPVRDYVFNDFNSDQANMVFAASNTAFSEIWWFYPSGSSTENDRYVVYNYMQNIWYYGTLARTAMVDRGLEATPIAAGADHYLYNQETGMDDGSQNPPTAISAYVTSSQMSIGAGDDFVFMDRVLPDITFRDSTATNPTATFTVEARNYPGGAYLQSDTNSVVKTASSPVEQFTNQLYVRVRGRSFAFKVSSADTGVTWRLGVPRVNIRSDGQR